MAAGSGSVERSSAAGEGGGAEEGGEVAAVAAAAAVSPLSPFGLVAGDGGRELTARRAAATAAFLSLPLLRERSSPTRRSIALRSSPSLSSSSAAVASLSLSSTAVATGV